MLSALIFKDNLPYYVNSLDYKAIRVYSFGRQWNPFVLLP